MITVKPKTTETGSSGISRYRNRYRSTSSSVTTYRHRTFSQNALPQRVSASLPQCLSTSLPQCLSTSLPQCLSASLPQCLTPSAPQILTPSVPQSLTPSLHCLSLSLPQCLSPSPGREYRRRFSGELPTPGGLVAKERFPANAGTGLCEGKWEIRGEMDISKKKKGSTGQRCGIIA